MTKQQLLEVQDYVEALSSATHERCFFTTRSGRIGLGPKHTEPGNVVCIFYNGYTPFTIRPREDSESKKRYVFIGESYVHGIMYGEAL
jgi:hypothetical protein